VSAPAPRVANAAGSPDAARVLIVRVGTERVALPVLAVREVIDAPTIVPVPMAPLALRGHCAVRGQHLPVLDLAQLLQIPRASEAVPVALVLASGDCALAVDDALDVWAPGESTPRALPAGGRNDGLVAGLLQRDAEVALLVDADALSARAVATLRGVSPQ
jgi:purine-binding chemotaxis protein CheW